MNQKGFIKTITLITIIACIVAVLAAAGTGVFLYKKDKFASLVSVKDGFFNATSGVIFKLAWQGKYEKQLLEHDLEFSNVKRNQAENKANEETIARAEAEDKAQQEEVLKNQAEAKAKQEEFEKKLKEQELDEKEQEEKRMSADNDGDGLSYRQELDLGSSDWTSDSDGDGIKDGFDSHPVGGDRLIAQHFEWNYEGTPWTWDYSFPSDWHDYYKNKFHGNHGIDYVTSDNKYIKQIANMLEIKANEKGYSKSEFAVSFIQSLGYVEDNVIGYDDYPKYPLETLAEQNGDCEDTSYLAAAIIDAMNIATVLIELPGHMAVGIAFSGSPSGYFYPQLWNGYDYYYIETTEEGWELGNMPSEYRNISAELIDVSSGASIKRQPSYIASCYSSSEFLGYYTDGSYYYKDSSCSNVISCLPYSGYYYSVYTESFYWNSSCDQIVVKGCYKSDTYSGYFFDDDGEYYYDSRCINKARLCRKPDYSYDYYWDGYNLYWDSNCTQQVVAGCDKSIYYPGYFFDGWSYYSDYRCSILADPY